MTLGKAPRIIARDATYLLFRLVGSGGCHRHSSTMRDGRGAVLMQGSCGAPRSFAEAAAAFPVTRRFVAVGGRRVHGRFVGSGPPALFVHSSPANSGFVLPEMLPLADRFTCYAFDTPGFGLSDPLPGEVLTISQLADALAELLEAIAMPACPVFGCHTGSAIALELARRHPQRVTGLMLDSLSCFTAEEFASIDAGYFQKFAADPLGGHFAAVWTRFRDQSIWFPWFARAPDALNESDLTSPAATNRWVSMFFDAQDTYAPAYRAAMAYRDGPAAISALRVPMVLTSIESDMLYRHLERVEPAGPEQQIVRVANNTQARRALTAETMARFASDGPPPALSPQVGSSTAIARQFIDVGHGQLLLRSTGEPASPALLLIHDVPGSSRQSERRILELARDRFVLAFDLPGCGESAALETSWLDDFADCLWDGLDALGIGTATLYGIGFGSVLAVAMAQRRRDRAAGVMLEGLLLPEPDERAALEARYAPAVTIEADGSHWFRTWQMLRDMSVWWPWFTPTRAALRRIPGDFDAVSLHRRTCETLRQPGGYAKFVAAALARDSGKDLDDLRIPVTFIEGSDNPLAGAYDERARARYPGAAWQVLGER